MRKSDNRLPVGRDPSGEDGARQLGAFIARYWQRKGYCVRVWIERVAHDSRHPVWAVRTNLGGNGFPTRKGGAA